MYFTVEEENLICLYHNADRRRTAANLRAALPDMDKEMAALACQTADKLDAISKTPGAGAVKASASGASFLSIFPHLEPRFEGNRITLSTCLPTMRKNP